MSDFVSELEKAGLLYGVKNTGPLKATIVWGNAFPRLTEEERESLDVVLNPALGPDVVYMNPRDYANLKIGMAWMDHLRNESIRLGRRLGRAEARWLEAKFYKKKCKPEFVDRIPFPEEA